MSGDMNDHAEMLAEEEQRAYEWWLSTLPPDVAKSYQAGVTLMQEALERCRSAYIAETAPIVRMLVNIERCARYSRPHGGYQHWPRKDPTTAP